MLRTRSRFIRLWFYAVSALLLSLGASFAAEPAKPAPVAPTAQPAPQPAAPPAPAPNYSQAAREMGFDVNAKMGEWSVELDRIDKELESKTLRYRDLDRNRDRLEQI